MLVLSRSIRRVSMQLTVSTAMLITSNLAVSSAELVIYQSDQCEVSQRFHRETDDEYAMTKAGEVFPLREVDIDSATDSMILLNSPVDRTPTFVIVDEGREIARMTGYPGREHFFRILNGAADEYEKLSTGD